MTAWIVWPETRKETPQMTLEDLETRIGLRAAASPEESYTAKLIARGINKSAQKLGEEATETVIAAIRDDRAEIASEAADLVFHLLVLLADADVSLDEVRAELRRREGVSGIDEKAGRGQ